MKNSIVLASVIGMLAVTSSVVASAITDISDGSIVTISNLFVADVLVSSANTATISNTMQATTNSGGNSVSSSGDQKSTSIVTGSAIASLSIADEANEISVNENFESSDTSSDTIESISNGSTAIIENSDRITGSILANQNVTQTNTVATTATSGNNAVYSGGTLIGTSIATGTANAETSISGLFNVTLQSITRTVIP